MTTSTSTFGSKGCLARGPLHTMEREGDEGRACLCSYLAMVAIFATVLFSAPRWAWVVRYVCQARHPLPYDRLPCTKV
jgi:hypothetical protein